MNVSFAVEAGFSTLSMTQVNGFLDDVADAFDGTATFMDKAIEAGVMVGFGITEQLKIGPKVELVYAIPGGVKGDDFQVATSGFAIPILGAVEYKIPLEGSDWAIGLNAGLGFALAKASTFIEIDGLGDDTLNLSGNGFVFEIGAKAMTGNFFVNAGYRALSVAQMICDNDADLLGAEAGDAAEDYDGDTMPFDYSGFVIGVGLQF